MKRRQIKNLEMTINGSRNRHSQSNDGNHKRRLRNSTSNMKTFERYWINYLLLEWEVNVQSDLFLFFIVAFVFVVRFDLEFFLNFEVNFDSRNVRTEKVADQESGSDDQRKSQSALVPERQKAQKAPMEFRVQAEDFRHAADLGRRYRRRWG